MILLIESFLELNTILIFDRFSPLLRKKISWIIREDFPKALNFYTYFFMDCFLIKSEYGCNYTNCSLLCYLWDHLKYSPFKSIVPWTQGNGDGRSCKISTKLNLFIHSFEDNDSNVGVIKLWQKYFHLLKKGYLPGYHFFGYWIFIQVKTVQWFVGRVEFLKIVFTCASIYHGLIMEKHRIGDL